MCAGDGCTGVHSSAAPPQRATPLLAMQSIKNPIHCRSRQRMLRVSIRTCDRQSFASPTLSPSVQQLATRAVDYLYPDFQSPRPEPAPPSSTTTTADRQSITPPARPPRNTNRAERGSPKSLPSSQTAPTTGEAERPTSRENRACSPSAVEQHDPKMAGWRRAEAESHAPHDGRRPPAGCTCGTEVGKKRSRGKQ